MHTFFLQRSSFWLKTELDFQRRCLVLARINRRISPFNINLIHNVLEQMQTGINGEKDLKTYLCNKDYCNAGEQLGGDYDLLGALGPIGKGLKGLKDAIDASEIIGKNLNDAINAGGPILGKGLKDAINAGLGAVGPSLVDWFSQLFAGGTENPGGNPGENPEGNPEGNLGGNNQTPQPNTIKF